MTLLGAEMLLPISKAHPECAAMRAGPREYHPRVILISQIHFLSWNPTHVKGLKSINNTHFLKVTFHDFVKFKKKVIQYFKKIKKRLVIILKEIKSKEARHRVKVSSPNLIPHSWLRQCRRKADGVFDFRCKILSQGIRSDATREKFLKGIALLLRGISSRRTDFF